MLATLPEPWSNSFDLSIQSLRLSDAKLECPFDHILLFSYKAQESMKTIVFIMVLRGGIANEIAMLCSSGEAQYRVARSPPKLEGPSALGV